MSEGKSNQIVRISKGKKQPSRVMGSNHNQPNSKPTDGNTQGKSEEGKTKLSQGMLEEFLSRYLESGNPAVLPYGCEPHMVHGEYNVYTYWESNSRDPRLVCVDQKAGLAEEIGITRMVGIIQDCLSRFANPEFPSGQYCLSNSQSFGLAKRLIASGRRLNSWPEPIGFKSSPGLFFKRHNFDPAASATPADFPTINLNLQHMTNARNFCERIGSAYDPASDRKQGIVMIGDGDGGKSTLANLITELAGGPDGVAFISMAVYSQFGLDPIVDKRFWIAEELSSAFYKNDKHKLLTGGAPVQINRKGERQFNAYLNGMLFAFSNHAPELVEDSGLRNRIIICEIDPVPPELRLPRHETEKRMREELPYFIRYCMDLYSLVGGNGTLTPDTTETIDNLISDSYCDFEVIFNRYFQEDLTKLRSDATVTTEAFSNHWELICEENPSFARAKGNTLKEFRKYVATRMGRKYYTENTYQKGKMVTGLTLKNPNRHI